MSTSTTSKEKGKAAAKVFRYIKESPTGEKDMCARYVRNDLESLYGVTGITGDAWTIDNKLPSQYSSGYRMFDSLPDLKTEQEMVNLIGSKLNDPKRVEAVKNASPLAIVNIFNPTSSYTKQAWNESTNTPGTHVGYVVEENGEKFVVHSINGKSKKEPISTFTDNTGMEIIGVSNNNNYVIQSEVPTEFSTEIPTPKLEEAVVTTPIVATETTSNEIPTTEPIKFEYTPIKRENSAYTQNMYNALFNRPKETLNLRNHGSKSRRTV